MSAFFFAVWMFLLAHPAMAVGALGAVMSLGMSLAKQALASSPRYAAIYSLLTRFFPDVSDPNALAQDLWALLTGKPAPQPATPLELASKPSTPAPSGDK